MAAQYGMVGRLPWRAWLEVAELLAVPGRQYTQSGLQPGRQPFSGGRDPREGRVWRSTVLNLRRVCKALLALVGAHCPGGAGFLDVGWSDQTVLDKVSTSSLGRALLVAAAHFFAGAVFEQRERDSVAALTAAVELGHMVSLLWQAPLHSEPATIQAAEAMLVKASSKGQLLHACLGSHGADHWALETLPQLEVLELEEPKRELVARIAGGGVLRRLELHSAKWGDMSMLQGLREVVLTRCNAVEDLSPLADVPKLVVHCCEGIEALPAMRNDWLEVIGCCWDVAGLAEGRVRRLCLQDLRMADVSAIGAMRPLPHTVILVAMHNVRDVSSLMDVPRLTAIGCPITNPRSFLAEEVDEGEEEDDGLDGLDGLGF